MRRTKHDLQTWRPSGCWPTTPIRTRDVLTVSDIDTVGTKGTVTCNANGSFTYDPNGKFESLGVGETATDSFNYTVSDGQGGADTATVTITIHGDTLQVSAGRDQ